MLIGMILAIATPRKVGGGGQDKLIHLCAMCFLLFSHFHPNYCFARLVYSVYSFGFLSARAFIRIITFPGEVGGRLLEAMEFDCDQKLHQNFDCIQMPPFWLYCK